MVVPTILNKVTKVATTLQYYENYIVLGDFNVNAESKPMMYFINSYKLRLIRMPTCFTDPENPSCIDLVLSNSPYSFQRTWVIETDLSYSRNMTVAVIKASFKNEA